MIIGIVMLGLIYLCSMLLATLAAGDALINNKRKAVINRALDAVHAKGTWRYVIVFFFIVVWPLYLAITVTIETAKFVREIPGDARTFWRAIDKR